MCMFSGFRSEFPPCARQVRSRAISRAQSGFTLLELLVVITIIGIISALAAVQFTHTPQKAKEAVLKEDLYILRDVIDQHFTDKGKYPTSLQDLVDRVDAVLATGTT